MSAPFDNESLPRPALYALAGLVVFSVVAVGAAQLLGYQGDVPPAAQVVEQRALRFSDGEAGLVQVRDAGNDRIVASISPGTENFIRGVIRSFARERRSLDIEPGIPFLLARHADGRLTIEDPSTGRQIELQAFGHTNTLAFSRLLASSSQDY